jgi:transcriptional regulator with XRE-family HTH domain
MASSLKRFKTRALARRDVREAYDTLGEEFAFLDEVLRARAKAGLTQAQLAERVGTTQSAIARLESGALRHSPSIATLQKYAKALGYRVEVKFVKDRGLTSASTRTRRARGSRLAG